MRAAGLSIVSFPLVSSWFDIWLEGKGRSDISSVAPLVRPAAFFLIWSHRSVESKSSEDGPTVLVSLSSMLKLDASAPAFDVEQRVQIS